MITKPVFINKLPDDYLTNICVIGGRLTGEISNKTVACCKELVLSLPKDGVRIIYGIESGYPRFIYDILCNTRSNMHKESVLITTGDEPCCVSDKAIMVNTDCEKRDLLSACPITIVAGGGVKTLWELKQIINTESIIFSLSSIAGVSSWSVQDEFNAVLNAKPSSNLVIPLDNPLTIRQIVFSYISRFVDGR